MWIILLSIFLGVCLLLLAFLLAQSPGKPGALRDEKGKPAEGSLTEKTWINVNGMRQGMFISARRQPAPVLLFLHGGPGLPEYFLAQRYPTGLEECFTVVWWDQRGSGLSYNTGATPQTMTVEQLVADTLAVTHLLCERFHQEKIYLMGHSGGSFIGILAAARAPQFYHAYIGVGQMAYQLESEQLAYDYMLDWYTKNGQPRMARRLLAATPPVCIPLPDGYARLRDQAMHAAGIGTTRAMKSVITGIFIPSWLSRVYTLREKLNLWRGKLYSMRCLRDVMFATDLPAQVPALDLPVYFFHGRYDYTCSYHLAKAFFQRLHAARKGFYTFEHSAHSPMFEEADHLVRILREDVLKGEFRWADAEDEAGVHVPAAEPGGETAGYPA